MSDLIYHEDHPCSLISCWSQGMVDYALASAGGRVIAHSKVVGPLPAWYKAWRLLASAFHGPHPVLPTADQVQHRCLPPNTRHSPYATGDWQQRVFLVLIQIPCRR